jgi:hypothetical protein
MNRRELEVEFKRIRNTSFNDIAERAGCSYAYVRRVLIGERIPRIHYFVAISLWQSGCPMKRCGNS